MAPVLLEASSQMAIHEKNGVLVCIWRGGDKVPVVRNETLGHVAVKLVGPSFAKATTDPRDRYVSWWPGQHRDGGFRLGRLALFTAAGVSLDYHADRRTMLGSAAEARLRDGAIPRPRQRVLNLGKDIALRRMPPGARTGDDGLVPRWAWEWGRSPDDKVFVPGRGPHGAAHGLDLAAIVAWWRRFRDAPDAVWSRPSQNCAAVAQMALGAGGAFETVAKPRHLLPRAATVQAWAYALQNAYGAPNALVARGGVAVAPGRAGRLALGAVTRGWPRRASP